MSGGPGNDTDVLIVGSGPTGLVLALWLVRLNVRVRIVDQTAGPGTTSRAVAVQARTLEFYRQLGFADEVVERGVWATAANLWTHGKLAAHIDMTGMGADVSPFPYPLIFPQDEHEQVLVNRLAVAGLEVERETELLGFENSDSGIRAHLRKADGTEQTCTASYLAGCDGARSVVREAVGVGFPGGTYEHFFYVADVKASGPAMDGGLNIAFDGSDFLAIFGMKGDGRARLIGTIRDDVQRPRDDLSWDDVSKHAIQQLRMDVQQVNWFSTYRVHHRVADHFRKGRAFLLGDAAHIHSPVGGQGMNTGIGDAVNLAWKLAAVAHGKASEPLLDSYEAERIAFARRLVATTDKAFTGVTSSGAMARWTRLHLIPIVVPLMFAVPSMRRYLFRTISQTLVNYRGSSLSVGRAGAVRGGDRLPWVQMDDGTDNFAPLTSLSWQLHVYGEARPETREFCAERGTPLHEFAWDRGMARRGLARDAAYLVRPDGYVAVAEAAGRPGPVASYAQGCGIVI